MERKGNFGCRVKFLPTKMRLLLILMLVLQASVMIFAEEVYEGQDISLVFQESLEESSLYMILFNDVTFYENRSPVDGSLPAEQLSRLEIQETPSSGFFKLQVNIQQADRADTGTYTLHVNPGTDSFVEVNIDLLVFYAPSAPLCDVIDNKVNCSATEGFPRGGTVITCYQGNDRLTSTLQVEAGGETIAARFNVSAEDMPIGCCTQSSSFSIAPGNCTQFIWKAPPKIRTTMNIMSTKNTSIPRETIRNLSTTDAPFTTDLYVDESFFYHKATLWFMGGILFVLVILYPFGLIYHFKINMREPRKYVSDSKGRGHFTKV